MNEPVKFPVFVVMRNDHIMPTGIHLHRANAEATAVREEGEVVPLYPRIEDTELLLDRAFLITVGHWEAHGAQVGCEVCDFNQALLERRKAVSPKAAASKDMVLVPRRATKEMCAAYALQVGYSRMPGDVWDAMISAAVSGDKQEKER